MKKYILSIVLGMLVGVFMSKTFLEEYDNYKGIKKVSNTGTNAYFIKYGTYKDEKELEKNTSKLINYIYTKEEDKYIVYIGITFDKNNLDKLLNYYKSLKYNVEVEEYVITSKPFIEYLTNTDKLISNSKDSSVIGEVCNQVLSKYEELVINGSKN